MDSSQVTDLLQLRLLAQRVELKSDLNRHAAREKFGKSDDKLVSNDLAAVYTESGRAAEIGRLFSPENCQATSQRLGHDPLQLSPLNCLKELWETFHPGNPEVAVPLLLV